MDTWQQVPPPLLSSLSSLLSSLFLSLFSFFLSFIFYFLISFLLLFFLFFYLLFLFFISNLLSLSLLLGEHPLCMRVCVYVVFCSTSSFSLTPLFPFYFGLIIACLPMP